MLQHLPGSLILAEEAYTDSEPLKVSIASLGSLLVNGILDKIFSKLEYLVQFLAVEVSIVDERVHVLDLGLQEL